MSSLKKPIEKELKALIKEALLNGDTHMLESLLGPHDKEMLQEIVWFAAIPAILKGLGAAATVGGAVWASDALGVTDNWYDKAVKYIDPMHYASSAVTDSPMFGESPNRAESGWLSKGIANKFKGKDFEEGIEVENKTDLRKRMEAGTSTTRDISQLLYDAMDGAGSGVDQVKSILAIDPNIKPGTADHLQMVGLWSEIYENFDEVTATEDDSDKDKDLIWWLQDEGDFDTEAKKMKELLAIYKMQPEELRNMYPELEKEVGGELAGEEGLDVEDEAIEAAETADDKGAVDTGGFAILGAGAAGMAKTRKAAASLFSAYEKLKKKPKGEMTEEETELLGILAQAAAKV